MGLEKMNTSKFIQLLQSALLYGEERTGKEIVRLISVLINYR